MKILKFLFIVVLITAVIVGILPLCVIGLRAYDAPPESIISSSLAFYIAILSVMLAVGLTVLLVKLLSGLFPHSRTQSDDPANPRGADATLAISIFALVAIFKTKALVGILGGLYNVLGYLLADSIKAMDWKYVHSVVYELQEKLGATAGNFSIIIGAYLQITGVLVNNVGRFAIALIQIVATSEAVAFYCWWLLLFLVARSATSATGQQSNIVIAAAGWLRARTPPQRQRMLLGVIFLVGLYFSIAAIIAIPALQQGNLVSPITRDYVEKALNSASAKESLQSKFPDIPKKVPEVLEKAARALEKVPQEILTRKANQPEAERENYAHFYEGRLQTAQTALASAKQLAEQAQENWVTMRADVLGRYETLGKDAVTTFEMGTINPLSSPERVAYLQELVDWFRNVQADSESALRAARSQLEELDGALTSAFSDVSGAIFAATPADPNPRGRIDAFSMLESFQYYQLRTSPSVGSLMNQNAPAPPEPGRFAGVFGFISQWLLQTRSFSLALITGMIGFGLLGAAVTNYVRTDIPNGQPVAAERVIIQGVSAAIVIFLTVHGGLAMMASGEKEPNGYVMCFACFVGAVFSEHVWLWARGRLQEMLALKQSTPSPTPTPAPTPNPAQPGSQSAPTPTA